MNWFILLQSSDHLLQLSIAKVLLPVVLLSCLWTWETLHPFFGQPSGRLIHAARNLLLALFNTIVLSLALGSATVFVANWSSQNGMGLLNFLNLSKATRFLFAIILLDGWMYVWHRANHVVPLFWRFHRMHHSDVHMDVTTATRFHLGEHLGAAMIRLGLIPILGFQIWHILAYELLVISNTQIHHANISVGRWDRWLRLMIVTPDMHKIHHSRLRFETDSNFSTLFSLWDRLARTFRMRSNLENIEYGLNEFDDPRLQTFWGMLRTPFISLPSVRGEDVERPNNSQLRLESASQRQKLTIGEPHD